MKFTKLLLLLTMASLSSCSASGNFAIESIVMGIIGIGVVSCVVFFIAVAIIKKETPAIVITVIIMLFLLGVILKV